MHPLIDPLTAAVERAVASIESAREGRAPGCTVDDASKLVATLNERLDELLAALRPLRALGSTSIGLLLQAAWPVWSRAMAVSALRPEAMLPPLCRLGSVGVDLTGEHFQPLLASTVAAVTTALAASPSDATPLVELATAVFVRFCDAPSMEVAFSNLLEQICGHVVPTLQPSPDRHAALAGALLTLANRYMRFLVPAIVYATSLPTLIDLATALLASCRAPEAVEPAIEFLSTCTRQARLLDHSELLSRLREALSGGAGQRLLRAAVHGLADSLPPSLVPRTADWLCPMLHLPSWRAAAPPHAPTLLHSWALAVLTELPVKDGVPDAHAKQALLRALTSMADCYAEGGALNIGVLEQLRADLCEFARVCRRLTSAATFDVAAYDWTADG